MDMIARHIIHKRFESSNSESNGILRSMSARPIARHIIDTRFESWYLALNGRL